MRASALNRLPVFHDKTSPQSFIRVHPCLSVVSSAPFFGMKASPIRVNSCPFVVKIYPHHSSAAECGAYSIFPFRRHFATFPGLSQEEFDNYGYN